MRVVPQPYIWIAPEVRVGVIKVRWMLKVSLGGKAIVRVYHKNEYQYKVIRVIRVA